MKSEVKSTVAVLLMTAALLISACAPDGGTVPSDPSILATYRGGQVTTGDLDAMILALPPQMRRLPADEASERDRELIELQAVNRLLLEQGVSEGIRTLPDFVLLHDENRQKIVADYFIRRELSRTEGVTEADARAYYEEHADELSQPAKRLTANIFRRVNNPDGIEAATREMQDLRQRIINGESFVALAREHSDSESAQRDGQLGWITKENAPPDLAAVVFALEPGVPSQPVTTGDGVHLFMVTDATAARDYTFDEVEGRIVSILNNQDRRALVEGLVADLPKPDPYFVADVDEMGFLLGGGDPDVEVFRIGESTLTVAEFRRLVDRAANAPGGSPGPDLPETVLAALVGRARIYEHCVSLGLLDEPELHLQLERAVEDDIVNYLRERSLREEAKLDGSAIEAYYQANHRRFSSPLLIDADVLIIPIPESGANEIMDRLSRLDLETAPDRLEVAATDLGGEVAQIENANLEQLLKWNQKIAVLVSGLEYGKCSQPIRIGDSIVVVEITRWVEPEPRPFATAIDDVVRSYLDDHRRDIYNRWAEKMIEQADLRIFDDRLKAFWRVGGARIGFSEPTGGPE